MGGDCHSLFFLTVSYDRVEYLENEVDLLLLAWASFSIIVSEPRYLKQRPIARHISAFNSLSEEKLNDVDNLIINFAPNQ